MKMFRFLCLCVLISVCSYSYAAVPVDQDEKKSHEFDIIIKTIESVNKAVSPDAIIKKYKLPTPIMPPRLGEDQVTALVNKEIDARVEAQYPRSRYKEIELEARRKFRMYKVNDLVTIRVMDPRRKVAMTLTTHIRKITARGVLLGDTFYIYRDIDRGEYAHFFRPHHDKAVLNEINREKSDYTKLRRSFEIQMRKELTKKIWHSEGYVYRLKTKKWVPREMVFEYRYQKEWLKKFDEIRPDVEITEYEAAGYTWNEARGRYERPRRESDPKESADEHVADANKSTKKVSESLENWSKMVGEIFSQGKSKKDIWGDDERGDGDSEKDKKKDKEKEDE